MTDPSQTSRPGLVDVGANLGAVNYVQTSGTPNVLVSATGLVTTAGTLSPGAYHVTGTTTDPTGDEGTFTFVLTVTKATTTPPVTPPVGLPASVEETLALLQRYGGR